jgi:hypothetical protein
MRTRLLMSLLALLLAAAAPPLPTELNDPATTEGWIWQQVQSGKVADLNDRCETPRLSPYQDKDPLWQAPCRRVNPDLLGTLLTQPDLADHASHGVWIIGARIDGDLNLHDAHIRAAEVRLIASWITGVTILSEAKLDGLLSLEGTLIQQMFDANLLHVGAGALFLRQTQFLGPVNLRDAQVEGQMDMERASVAEGQLFDGERLHVGAGGLLSRGVTFGGPVDLLDLHVEGEMTMEGVSVADQQTFNAERLHVGVGGLFLRQAKFGGSVNLRESHVEGQMDMEGADVADEQKFDAERLHVGTGLFLHQAKFGGTVVLRDAHIEGQMDMKGATVADELSGERLHVGTGGLLVRNVAFGGPVDLRRALIDGQMAMEDVSVANQRMFYAERLHVGGDFIAHRVKFGGPVNLLLLVVDGGLDLRDSHVQQLDLRGAVVRDDLTLGGRFDNGSEGWLHWDYGDATGFNLDLRNARVGNLQDDERAWPPRNLLEGFTYTHLGGIGGDQRQDMRNRPIAWWRDWLSRDPVYSAQPYTQLASVLTAAGNRDHAAYIRFFGRDRERSELLRGCVWLQKLSLVEKPDDGRLCQWRPAVGLGALQTFVGYGTGDYAFRAVGWALVLALIGTVILCFTPGVRGVRPSPAARRRGPRQKSTLWCFGASLHHVLPLVTISQEFSEFFNDPKRERLYAWQHVAFGVLALCGWALGLFVVAAFSGLIQS